MHRSSTGRRIARLLIAAAAAAAALALPGSQAFGASTHPFVEEWPTGANCSPGSVATDAAGNVYVACEGTGSNGLVGSIRKFSPTGSPITFSASKPYIAGNEINEDPGNTKEGEFAHRFGRFTQIAVDQSSARPGYIYVSSPSSENIEIFAPSGEYQTSIKGEFFTGEADGVGVDQNGYIYGVWAGCCGRAHMSKYNPQNFHEELRMVPYKGPFGAEPFNGPCCSYIAPDNREAIWVGWGGTFGGSNGKFGKWEPDQWSTNTNAGEKDASTVVATPSPYLREAFPEINCPATETISNAQHNCSLVGNSFGVDLNNNDVYANDGTKITPYSQGLPGDPVHQDGPEFGSGLLGNSGQGVAIDLSGNVYVTAETDKVVKFGKGAILPTITTKEAAIADIGHNTATVRGLVDPDGGGEIIECKVKYGATKSYGNVAPCNELTPYPGSATKEVSALLVGLTPGSKYHYRFEAANAAGNNFGGDRILEAKAVLKLETKPATGINQHEATLNGQLDPDGLETEYWFEYGPSTSYGLTTQVNGEGIPVSGAPGEIKQTPFLLTHLQAGHTYHYRLVAKNNLGTTKGGDLSFRTASPPEISGVGVANVTDTSADIHAQINPVGFATTYVFHYGPTPAYGSTLPISGNELTGNTPQTVEVHLSGLPPATTIHYKVVATNQWGTSETDDTTFNFRPPSCPNSHVRQITGSSYLPDCRAYELVSPGYAGAVQLLPGEALRNFAEGFGGAEFAQSPQNYGYANSPSRFIYWGGLGSVNEIDTPNSVIDIYLATRTNRGWVTSMPGLHGSETKYSFGRSCSDSLDLCADHIGGLYVQNAETGEYENVPKSNAPFLYKADGTRLGRLPTNVNVIKDGTKFKGDQMFSGDYSHFIFSTQTKFTPDGLTTPPGSVYDNDIGAATLEVISKDANGKDIEVEPSKVGEPRRITGIAGVSPDASHVLLAGTTAAYPNPNVGVPWILAQPARLYMRLPDAKLTYDVSRGKEVKFVGETRDLRKVYFTSTEQLIPGTEPGQDNDTSRDLYMWQEEGDQLTLISREGSLGNTDNCSSSWVAKCGVEPLSPEYKNFSELFEMRTRIEGIDDVLANQSGDIYFYSPEDLVPGEVGGDGQRNLYLFRNGHLHLVTTFEPSRPVERVTISQDGGHAAFMTRTSVSAYNSEGQQEVYSYNADTGVIRCASCNPSGNKPQLGAQTVTVSEAGPFMSNDGRTFFATRESLVPQDTDGIRDVYEYVDGRPQLISSGTGNRESTGGLETISAFFGTSQIGLESVSRDGTDVYFSTFETLTPDDKNGSFLKFYDARSGGGFDFNPDLEECAAADECHGDATQPPIPAQTGTAGQLGSSGNLPKHKRHRKKRHHKHHKHHKRHGHSHGSHGNG